MPSGLAAALAAPIREVQALVGPGSADTATAELTDMLRDARIALQELSVSVAQSWQRAAPDWTGSGADAAAGVVTETVTGAEQLADRLGRLGSSTEAAGDAVARASARLRDIVDAFEARAAALEPFLDSPAATEELVADARRSLTEAVAVVDELRAELDGHAAAWPVAPATAGVPATTSPAGATFPAGATTPSLGSGFSGAPLSGGSGGSRATPSSGAGLAGLIRDIAGVSTELPTPPADFAATFGDGVAVRLPDGSTATAPNAVAAEAVRNALTQLGVPYDWGGTTPGVGLDCSGLTQWAYGEAGLTIPRLAQEQDIGAPVAAGALRPGDLAVWDGHVAMVVGNGQMIEAGDPVQLSPIRTTNAGQGFQGFWRPTA